MPKKRDSQATIQQILDVSQRLFSEKGYEKTSIQDILHDLNGLSKGAIYHHFASKEEILEAVITRMSEQSVQFLNKIRADSTMNGAQKLKAIFCGSIAQPIQDDLFQAAPRLYDDPFMLARMRDDSIHHVAPAYIAPLIREGVEDGSIVTGYPDELAELLLLAGNIWLNPLAIQADANKITRKAKLLQKMLRQCALDLIEDEAIERLAHLATLASKAA